ncbi:MAG: DEAD/DEAH box helicase [Planctomycetota bacterium]
MSFESLGLAEPLQRALCAAGYEQPTPIQSAAIPKIMEGLDCLGAAQTGTGKTAAFALPILHRMLESGYARVNSARPAHVRNGSASNRKSSRHRDAPIRTLVLSPTRELAAQIDENFRRYAKYTSIRCVCVYGGVNQNPQTRQLAAGADILVATPGRLLDLVGQGFVSLRNIETFVLDEADHMLDMGFLPDVRRILSMMPAQRQNLMFSATMPSPIRKLADSILKEPATISIAPSQPTVDRIEQGVCFVAQADKPRLLAHYLETHAAGSTLVFTRTKHGANAVARRLVKRRIHAEAIHGNKTQASRQRSLDGFRSGKLDVLVATDVAARGIDVDGIHTVINYDAPTTAEAYVHRIGRTGRAGREGTTVLFCGGHENKLFRQIERHLKREIPVVLGGPGCQDRPLPDPDSAESATSDRSRQRTGGPSKRSTRARPSGGGEPSHGGKRGFRRRGRAAGSLSGTGSTSGREGGGSPHPSKSRKRRRPH